MHTSLACISDLLQHDVNAVYAFQYIIIHEFIKNELSQITNINYFSDGQYKNHKNFTNFFHHIDVFHISAEWYFFVTSHGNNACDSIGVTIKRLVAYSSLQKVAAGQTTEFCIENITDIKVFYVSTEEVRSFEPMLVERFKDSRIFRGTHSHHCFRISQDYKCTLHSRVSGDEMLEPITVPQSVDVWSLQIGKYVACLYEKYWFVGIIIKISSEVYASKRSICNV